eukprot:8974379-Pyramimonas_sp.AAC.1
MHLRGRGPNGTPRTVWTERRPRPLNSALARSLSTLASAFIYNARPVYGDLGVFRRGGLKCLLMRPNGPQPKTLEGAPRSSQQAFVSRTLFSAERNSYDG